MVSLEKVGASPELSPIELVDRYCTVVARSTDLEELSSVQGLLDDTMFHNTPGSSTSEEHTYYLMSALSDYALNSNHTRAEVQACRAFALRHVLRAAIQGEKWPLDDLKTVVTRVREGLLTVADPWDVRQTMSSEQAERHLHTELATITATPEVEPRLAEVRKHIAPENSDPFTRGRLARLAFRK